MNTKVITITIVLAAVTVVLNPALSGIGVPAPYAPYLIYQIWEIPIVAAFLLLGVKYGLSISVLNAAVLLAIFPGAMLMGPLYNLIAIVSMLLGVYLIQRIHNHGIAENKKGESFLKHETKLVSLSTIVGIVLRITVMVVVNYAVLRFPPPVGYSMPEGAILATLPLIGIFNATLALYTIPIGHVIANAVKKNLKFT